MSDEKSIKKPIVVNDKNLMTEAQRIIYKRLVDELQAARLAADQEQQQQKMSDAANTKLNEYHNTLREWNERTSNKESITAQTLPATLLCDLVLLSNLWGTMIRHHLDAEFRLPAKLSADLKLKVNEISFKTQNFITRKLFDNDPLALPEVSHYVALDESGKLKTDPVFEQPSRQEIAAGKKDLTDDQKRLNDIVNQACIAWLEKRGYQFSKEDGCFTSTGDKPTKLGKKEFAELAKHSVDGLDQYLLENCKVHFTMKEQLEPEPEQSTPRPSS